MSETITVQVVMSSADPGLHNLECIWNLCEFNRAKLKQDGGNRALCHEHKTRDGITCEKNTENIDWKYLMLI